MEGGAVSVCAPMANARQHDSLAPSECVHAPIRTCSMSTSVSHRATPVSAGGGICTPVCGCPRVGMRSSTNWVAILYSPRWHAVRQAGCKRRDASARWAAAAHRLAHALRKRQRLQAAGPPRMGSSRAGRPIMPTVVHSMRERRAPPGAAAARKLAPPRSASPPRASSAAPRAASGTSPSRVAPCR